MAIVVDNLTLTRISFVEGGLLRGRAGAWMIRGVNTKQGAVMKSPTLAVQKLWEQRRTAPLHYWSRADNARLSAYVLWRNSTPEAHGAPAMATEIGYYGNIKISMNEAFLREASIAIELIIKAVICAKIEKGLIAKEALKNTHDVVDLWRSAGLPELAGEDIYRITIIKRTLMWSGRYPVPTKADKLGKDIEEVQRVSLKEDLGSIKVRRPITFAFEEFDNIYMLAQRELSKHLSNIVISTIPDDQCST